MNISPKDGLFSPMYGFFAKNINSCGKNMKFCQNLFFSEKFDIFIKNLHYYAENVDIFGKMLTFIKNHFTESMNFQKMPFLAKIIGFFKKYLFQQK